MKKQKININIQRDINGFGRKLANWLNKLTSHFSNLQNRLLLMLICLAFSSVSLYLILNAIL